MRIINLCVDDWANFSYDNAQAMRSVGIDARSYKLNKHIANYANECEIVSVETMIEECKTADIIQIVHNNEYLLSRVMPALPGKKVNVIYTGTTYRVNPEKYNSIFNPIVDKSIIALGEFAGQGAKNEIYLVGAINTHKYHPEIKLKNHPYEVAHYPSNPIVKGSQQIIEMMNLVGCKRLHDFIHSNNFVNSEVQYNRLNACDIYIELFAPLNNGKKYGSWGITALEAAALGKVVITMNLSNNVYEKAYGDCALEIANSEHEFYDKIFDLIYSTPNRIFEKKINTLKWVEEKHSYKATGKYILKNILNV